MKWKGKLKKENFFDVIPHTSTVDKCMSKISSVGVSWMKRWASFALLSISCLVLVWLLRSPCCRSTGGQKWALLPSATVYCLPILYAFQAALIFSLMLLLFSIFTFSWLSNKFFLTMHEGKMQTSLSIQVVHALSYNTISLSLSLFLYFH